MLHACSYLPSSYSSAPTPTQTPPGMYTRTINVGGSQLTTTRNPKEHRAPSPDPPRRRVDPKEKTKPLTPTKRNSTREGGRSVSSPLTYSWCVCPYTDILTHYTIYHPIFPPPPPTPPSPVLPPPSASALPRQGLYYCGYEGEGERRRRPTTFERSQ